MKARSATGSVALTQNEWFKAKRFKDQYYLYTVMNVGSKPTLYIVQDPAASLDASEKREIVRYIVPFKEISKKGYAINT